MFFGLRSLASRFRALFSRARHDADFHREVEEHLAMMAADFESAGMTPEEARREAGLRFGARSLIEEHQREHRAFAFLDSCLADFRYALRTLARSPGFTAVAVATLAVGIGLNATIFTAIDAVALKPLPVKEPDHVFRVVRRPTGGLGGGEEPLTYAQYLFYRSQNRSFTDLVASGPSIAVSTGAELPFVLRGQLVSENYFSALSPAIALGRGFAPRDLLDSGNAAIVLSHACWQARYAADPLIVGRTVLLNGAPATIYGVAAPGFTGTSSPPHVPDFWAPIAARPLLQPDSGVRSSQSEDIAAVLGRLRPQIVPGAAAAELNLLVRRWESLYPPGDAASRPAGMRVERASYFAETGDFRFQLLVAVLMLLVSVILLIACANLANMLFARAAGRRREIGLRLAIGASRGRIIRQLLVESLTLSLLGGAAGLLASVWSSKLLWNAIEPTVQALFSTSSALAIDLAPDGRVLAFGFLLSIAAGIAFGLAPALECCRQDLSAAMKDQSALGAARFDAPAMRRFLLMAQVAASMSFLAVAGLLARGLIRAQSTDPGFDAGRVYLVQFRAANGAASRITDALHSLPQVERTAYVAGNIPLEGTWTSTVQPEAASVLPMSTFATFVSRAYFETLGIPLLAGRTFTSDEERENGPAAVISASGARRLWPGRNPLGGRFRMIGRLGERKTYEVVGVVKDLRNGQLSRVDDCFVYLPTGAGRLLIRTADPRGVARALAATLGGADAATLSLTSIADGPMRLQLLLTEAYGGAAIALAAIALFLAAIGIYGLTSYLVTQRTREMGVRIALGAGAAGVLRAVASDCLRPVFWGASLGLVFALAIAVLLRAMLLTPSMPDMLFGASAFDPALFLALAGFMAAVTAIAAAAPAARALGVDPMTALRHE
jgi:predicted permease